LKLQTTKQVTDFKNSSGVMQSLDVWNSTKNFITH